MKPGEYLELPYHYILVYDNVSKTWTGTVKEFSGCIAQGDACSLVFNLRRAAKHWIAAALELGQEIPEPEDD
jgi:predicted RNase H-like HicB family nuclease